MFVIVVLLALSLVVGLCYLIYVIVSECWAYIFVVLAVIFVIWIVVKNARKRSRERKAFNQEMKKREMEQKRERRRVLTLKVNDCKERIARLEEQKGTVEERSLETANFEDMFAAIGISGENLVSENERASIQNLQKQIESSKRKLRKLNRELKLDE